MKNIIIILVVILGAGLGAYAWYMYTSSTATVVEPEPVVDTEVVDNDHEVSGDPDEAETDTEQPPEPAVRTTPEAGETIIGTSAGGHDIVAHTFGSGEQTVLFVGGVHGGYAFNTTLLAYELIEYLATDERRVPADMTVTVIPALNPDGLVRAGASAERFTATAITNDTTVRTRSRFNDNNVDINRNFDCQWQASGQWQDQTVNAGSAPFSEPEAQAIQGFVQAYLPVAVITWYAAAGEVFPAACGNDNPSAATLALRDAYANATPYTAAAEFTYYPITGDMMDWLAANDIPAISVLLSDRESTEWEANRAGVTAVLEQLSQ